MEKNELCRANTDLIWKKIEIVLDLKKLGFI